ncbi:MAG: hypothetical protein JW795_03300, partial [Chitinivibrionales bacterium]|nr:hypothetical protein [Chitinivibrionales bacterium]
NENENENKDDNKDDNDNEIDHVSVSDSKSESGNTRKKSSNTSLDHKPEWKKKCKTFESYQKWELEEYNKIISDSEWLKEREKYHPRLNVPMSLEKAHKDFWGEKSGWKNIRARRGCEVDWKATWTNSLTIRCNQVWYKTWEVGRSVKTIKNTIDISIIKSRLVELLGPDYDFPADDDHDSWFLLYETKHQ